MGSEHRNRDKDLGEWIEYARIGFEEDLYRLMEDQGVSQADLAKASGVSSAFISKVLNGNGNYTLKTMAKLGRALGGVLEVRLMRENEEVIRLVSPDVARLLDDQGLTDCPPAPDVDQDGVVTFKQISGKRGTG